MLHSSPRRGQGLLDYGMIIVAVALVVIVLVFLFGGQVGSLFVRSGSSLS